jgi:hypothetical protein
LEIVWLISSIKGTRKLVQVVSYVSRTRCPVFTKQNVLETRKQPLSTKRRLMNILSSFSLNLFGSIMSKNKDRIKDLERRVAKLEAQLRLAQDRISILEAKKNLVPRRPDRKPWEPNYPYPPYTPYYPGPVVTYTTDNTQPRPPVFVY